MVWRLFMQKLFRTTPKKGSAINVQHMVWRATELLQV